MDPLSLIIVGVFAVIIVIIIALTAGTVLVARAEARKAEADVREGRPKL